MGADEAACRFCGESCKIYGNEWDYEDGVVIDMSRGADGSTAIEATGYYDGGYVCGVATVEIGYCPFCGRELKGES